MRGFTERIVPERWRRRQVTAAIAAAGQQPPAPRVKKKKSAAIQQSQQQPQEQKDTEAGEALPAAASAAATAAEPVASDFVPSSARPNATAAAAVPDVSYRCRLAVHPASFSEDEVIFNPRHFPLLQVGDLVHLTKLRDGAETSAQSSAAAPPPALSSGSGASAVHGSGGVDRREVRAVSTSGSSGVQSSSSPLLVRVLRLGAVKGNIECSLLSSLAALFGLGARDEVAVQRVSAASVAAESVELSFDHAYIGRSDHWRIRSALQQQTVHTGKAVQVEGMRLRIDDISRRSADVDDGPVRCSSGLVLASTRLTFRSRSARLLFLVQLSAEMWEYADDGEVRFEKVVGFLRLLLGRWRDTHVSHALSIVLFSRTHADADADSGEQSGPEDGGVAQPPLPAPSAPLSLCVAPAVRYSVDGVGRLYMDHYEVVADGDTPDDDDSGQWGARLLVALKTAFHCYRAQMQWGARLTLRPEQIDRSPPPANAVSVRLSPSSAAEGNVLEAINCAVSIFDAHYVDRDLYRTGQNIVLCSAGQGLFVVSDTLAQLTKQRMVDGGIGCDLILMTRPPLHAAPLFVYDPALFRDPHAALFPRLHQRTQRSSASPAAAEAAADGRSAAQPRRRPPLVRSTSTQSASPASSSPPFSFSPRSFPFNASASPSPLYYLPHWISVYFYDYQDLYDTPFGTRKPPEGTTDGSPSARRTRIRAAAGDGAKPHSREDDEEEDSDGSSEDARSGSSPQSTSFPLSTPLVGLSSCPLYDFRPTEPTALSAWLFHSAPSSALPPRAFSARFSPAEAPTGPALSLPAANGRAEYDDGVFDFGPPQAASADPSTLRPSPSSTLMGPSSLRRAFTAASGGAYATAYSPASSPLAAPSPESASLFPAFSPVVSWSLTFARRWAHLHFFREEARQALFEPNWKSLTKPAMLPLTVDYLQSAEELLTHYAEYNYSLTLSDEHDNEALLEEIICQRQAQDYQNVTAHHHSAPVAASPASTPLGPASPSLLPPSPLPSPPQPPLPRFNLAVAAAKRRAEHGRLSGHREADKASTSPAAPSSSPPPLSASAARGSAAASSASAASPLVYYFSLRYQVHCLSYEPARSSISVKRYVHKRWLANAARLLRVPYRYQLWSPLTGGFLPCERAIEPNTDDLDWNYADQLLAGQHDDYEDKLRYRRVRLAFLPPQHSPGERGRTAALCGQRVQAMDALWQAVLKKSLAQLNVRVAQPRRRLGKEAVPSPHSGARGAPLWPSTPPASPSVPVSPSDGSGSARRSSLISPAGAVRVEAPALSTHSPSPSPPLHPRTIAPSSRSTSPAEALEGGDEADEQWDVESTGVGEADGASSTRRSAAEIDDVLRSGCRLRSARVPGAHAEGAAAAQYDPLVARCAAAVGLGSADVRPARAAAR